MASDNTNKTKHRWYNTPAQHESTRSDFMQLTLGPADGIHEDIVLVGLVFVVLKLSLQTQQLLIGELP